MSEKLRVTLFKSHLLDQEPIRQLDELCFESSWSSRIFTIGHLAENHLLNTYPDVLATYVSARHYRGINIPSSTRQLIEVAQSSAVPIAIFCPEPDQVMGLCLSGLDAIFKTEKHYIPKEQLAEFTAWLGKVSGLNGMIH